MQQILLLFGKCFYPYFLCLKCSLYNNHLRKFKCFLLVINKMNFLKNIIKKISVRWKITFNIFRMKFKNMIIFCINRRKKITILKNKIRIMVKVKILIKKSQLIKLNLKPIKFIQNCKIQINNKLSNFSKKKIILHLNYNITIKRT